MIYHIYKRTDGEVLQYLVPNSAREKYIAGLKDASGSPLYIKIGTTEQKPDDGGGGETPPITGGGDMFKATYDTNSNNIVDRAERADAMVWNGFL